MRNGIGLCLQYSFLDGSVLSPRETELNGAMQSPHVLTIADVAKELGTNASEGLTSQEAETRAQKYGPNQLDEAPPIPTWKRLLAQFTDIVIWILIGGAIISILLGEWVDAIAIGAIVLLNGLISFVQEMRAEESLAALRKLSTPNAKVFRSGHLQSLPSREVVPGDIIELDAGDHVPADARLTLSYGLTIQEAALTGESLPVQKSSETTLPESTGVGDRQNMVHMGTVVAAGKGRAIVTSTGMATELGNIAGLLKQQRPDPTPLQRRLSELGRILIVVCLAIVVVIFLLQYLRGGDLAEAFLIGVSLSVAAVPEGLPAVVTISLALGLQRMVKRNALVRNLPSVETLGTVTVICSDKTGTLTKNEMTVEQIYTVGDHYELTGVGYRPQGTFNRLSANPTTLAPKLSPASDQNLDLLLKIASWCNNAQAVPPKSEENDWSIIGDPTEGALIIAAMKRGIPLRSNNDHILFEIPFDSTRKLMSIAFSENGSLLYTKGAPESVLDRCKCYFEDGVVKGIDDDIRRLILQQNTLMAHEALRVLAVAYRGDVEHVSPESLEENLVFVGLIGMMDPPREEAKVAVERCISAGICPVMITGDHLETASAIGKKLGILRPGSDAIVASQIDEMTPAELQRQAEHISVYARASAEHKLRIIESLQSRGDVVAMTGDGVNDAPAVKAADIGIAMGITGTDVTKEASDMVLTDDNFASIVAAVEEGRGIYDNIQKVLLFLLSCNAGEIMLMLVTSLLGWPAPLLPVQLLWINLVTDGLPALALSLEAPEPGIMRRRPRGKKESILDLNAGATILLQGSLVASAAFIAFAFIYRQDVENLARAQVMAFSVLVFAELLRAITARSRTIPILRLGLFTNPALFTSVAISAILQLCVTLVPFTQHVFGTAYFSLFEWLMVAALSFMPFFVLEGTKWMRSRPAA